MFKNFMRVFAFSQITGVIARFYNFRGVFTYLRVFSWSNNKRILLLVLFIRNIWLFWFIA